MLVLVTWVACLRRWRANVSGVGSVLAWGANMVVVSGVLTWVACYSYCYCYCIANGMLLLLKYYPEEKNVVCLLLKQKWNNVPNRSNSDLKEELDFKRRCCFILFEPVMRRSWICLNLNVGKYAPICVTLWVSLNMREILRA